MAIATELVAQTYFDVVPDVPISVPIPAFEVDDVLVFYGSAGLIAIQNTDYLVELDTVNFNTIEITPLDSLIDKIDALILADDTEINYITVRRQMDYLTESTPGITRDTVFTSREFDRIAMRFQQLSEASERAVKYGDEVTGQPEIKLSVLQDQRALILDGDRLVSGPLATDIASAQAFALAAQAAQLAAEAAALAAATFDPALFLSKLGNLSGLADTVAAQTNLGGTATGRALFGAADQAAGRTAINAQVLSAMLTALTSLGGSLVAGDIIQATGPNAIARFAKGAAGKFLGYDADGLVLLDGAVKNYQVFTANGTWTKPVGTNPDALVWVELWGAGAAGRRDGSTGGGGGGGCYARAAFRAGDLTATVAVTVGTGGAGTTGTGGSGGFSQFANYIRANGGSTNSGTAGVGGTLSTLDKTRARHLFYEQGASGGAANTVGGDADYAGAGGGGAGVTPAGGTSKLGGNGGTGGNNSPVSTDGAVPGGGGGGQVNGSAGADGGRGEVRVWVE